ncbi:MarR family winged helix-turn-helix transcriptional regulator [Microbacterium hatanonis]|uniref:Winged helix-turn-helix transcriptional regulator n=1 Tax=Microbacterium hatanonis TaxID=404366 RepID=A0A5C8I5B4_9MICO|nr:MarR family winged helix-turn-helix transcriptional regulator [Microbacterium hatanonis]TXK13360.1 winged helix-turn-helix transcriptional regulator [Microbacterium hatanonis]
MDASALNRAMDLLGQFSDRLTHVFDDAFGTRWAEIEDILAIAEILTGRFVTTRLLADTSGLDRRAISRMVARLRSEELVTTRPSAADKRAVEVVLTDRGERQAAVLRASLDDFFRASSEIASQIAHGLQPSSRPPLKGAPADPVDLLRRVCEAGAALVNTMPGAATQGQLAARQRAALVQIVSQGGARPNDLSPALGVSRAGVAYIIDQLCAKGFVSRRRGTVPEDRRAVVLEATADGVRAVQAVMAGIEGQRESLANLFGEVAHWRELVVEAEPLGLATNAGG